MSVEQQFKTLQKYVNTSKLSILPKISSPLKPRVNVSFCISVGTSYSHSAKPFLVSSLKGKSENVLIFLESI